MINLQTSEQFRRSSRNYITSHPDRRDIQIQMRHFVGVNYVLTRLVYLNSIRVI